MKTPTHLPSTKPPHPSQTTLRTVVGLTLLFASLLFGLHASAADVSGEYKTWHKLTLTFDGPTCSETGDPNPFTDYQPPAPPKATNGGCTSAPTKPAPGNGKPASRI